MDPYLFDNFNTVDGDFLTAKFRAFKFPESTYVQFRGTVNVCVDKCKGIQCSNGQVGYGRRRRRSIDSSPDPNKVYEISMTTFIRVTNDEAGDKCKLALKLRALSCILESFFFLYFTATLSELEQKLRLLKEVNQKRNLRESHLDEGMQSDGHHLMDSQTKDSEAYIEETTLTRLQQHNGASPMMMSHSCPHSMALSVTSLVALLLTTIAMFY